jgi:hypothetical protein
VPLDHVEPTETIQSGAVSGLPNKAGALTNLAGRKELHRVINFCERLERSEAIERLERFEQIVSDFPPAPTRSW